MIGGSAARNFNGRSARSASTALGGGCSDTATTVTIFAVRSVANAGGCALWITDYATILAGTTPPPPSPRVSGHELGHACNLWHLCVDDDIRNLMATKAACDPDLNTTADVADPRMADWQVLLVRASKHVTYS